MLERKVNALAIAEQHWQPLPEWVRTLAQFSDEHTQVAASRRIGKSASLVNMVLKNNYKGDLRGVQQLVETAFDVAKRRCPVLGSISGSDCLKHQTAPYNPANHMAVGLFRACRRCPHNQKGVKA